MRGKYLWYNNLHEGVPDEKQGSSVNGEPPCGIEVQAMPKGRRRAKRKQRRSFLPWIDKIAAAIYWIVKTILLFF